MALDAANRAVIERLAQDWRLTPATFAHKINRGRWIPKPFHLHVSARIAKSIIHGGPHLIISAPPRHGKSDLGSVHTPGWVLERFPHKQVILASYGADLAVGFSRKVRDMFRDKSNQDLLTTRISRDSHAADFFHTTAGGFMTGVGLGGTITGYGAHVLLIDDFIKEVKEALSVTYREYVWNWFRTTAFTRLEPGGVCIIIATRWHTDDLIGRILRELPGLFEYIEIPALAEEGDVLGRAVGEPLFPERYPLEELNSRREVLGSIWFQAIFQQKPVDETQKLTDSRWFEVVSSVPELQKCKLIRFWDLAATEGGGDYTVGLLMAYNPKNGDTYILNVVRKQLSPGQVETWVRSVADVDTPEVKVVIEQEPGSAGKSLVNHYKVNILRGFSVEGYPVSKNKLVRAQPFLAAAEAGKVKLLKGQWNTPFMSEFDRFPGGDFDDQVSAAGDAYTKISGKKTFTVSWGREYMAEGSSKGARANMYQKEMRRHASIITTTTPSGRGVAWGR